MSQATLSTAWPSLLKTGLFPIIYAVLAVCALAIVAALAVSSIAYYGLWVLAIGTFLLAVYYTVKMM